jgi:glycerophosphoryl diester phosphodiesterase
VNLLRQDGRPLVIGHRGAAAVAPENTFDSLKAAVAAGADLVEFDVGPDLLLAHSAREAPEEDVTLDDALEYLNAQGVGIHVDVKQPGYEEQVVDALRSHDIVERSVVSTAFPVTLRRIRALLPDVSRAIGYPRDRYGVSRVHWPSALVRPGAVALRAAMPARLPLLMRASEADVLALHHTLCSRAAVRFAHGRYVPLLGWTANTPQLVRRLDALGVDAIVSDDPGMALATLRAP